jgi:hypothetical protein
MPTSRMGYGLRIIAVSDPAHPREVGFYYTSGVAEAVAVSGGYAYVADDWADDLAACASSPSPTRPTPMRSASTTRRGMPWAVAVSGGYAYVVDGRAGLFILRYTGSPPPAPTYSVSGRVADASGNPIANVTVSAGAAGSAVTGSDGRYTISGLAAGDYTLRPAKTGFVFIPESLNVRVSGNVGNQNFVGHAVPCAVPVSAPFLQFPIDFGSKAPFGRAVQDTDNGGLINSWFDHNTPQYRNDAARPGLTLFDGKDYNANRGNHVWGGLYCYDGRCYEGHDGMDIVPPDKQEESPTPTSRRLRPVGWCTCAPPSRGVATWANRCGLTTAITTPPFMLICTRYRSVSTRR